MGKGYEISGLNNNVIHTIRMNGLLFGHDI